MAHKSKIMANKTNNMFKNMANKTNMTEKPHLDKIVDNISLKEILEERAKSENKEITPYPTENAKAIAIIPKVDYQPTTLEVVGETGKIFYGVIKTIARGIYTTTDSFLSGSAFPLIIPTGIRWIKEADENIKQENNLLFKEGLTGVFGGLSSLGYLVYGCASIYSSFYYPIDSPLLLSPFTLLGVTAVTNVASGLYEAQRKAKKQLKESKTKNLENIVDTKKVQLKI